MLRCLGEDGVVRGVAAAIVEKGQGFVAAVGLSQDGGEAEAGQREVGTNGQGGGEGAGGFLGAAEVQEDHAEDEAGLRVDRIELLSRSEFARRVRQAPLDGQDAAEFGAQPGFVAGGELR